MLNLLVKLFIIWALAQLAIDALQHRPAVLVVGLLALVAMALVVRHLLLPGPPQGVQARQRWRLRVKTSRGWHGCLPCGRRGQSSPLPWWRQYCF
jgi:hypothetical protein